MDPQPPPPPPQSPRRRSWPFALGLLAIAALLPLGWSLFLDRPPPPAVVPPAAPDAGVELPVQVTLAEVQGEVEIRGVDGGWRPAAAQDVLAANEVVRTKDGAAAVLVGGERWEVRLEPGTEVGVGELSASISRLLLGAGMAHATVKGEGRHTFEVKATVGDAVARTDGGTFTISHNGAGTVAVGTHAGEVEFLGGGRVVVVRAGQSSIVKPGLPPTEPAPIPAALLLKVALPASLTTNKPKVVVRGQVLPGSRVEVGGRTVAVDQDGAFEVPLVLPEGKSTLGVRAQGVGRQDAASAHAVEVKTQVKKVTIDRDLWK